MEKSGWNFTAILLSIVASLSLIFTTHTSHSVKNSLVDAQKDESKNSVIETKPLKSKSGNKIFFDRIFMHDKDYYSVFSVEENKTVTITSYHGISFRKIDLVCDVEVGEKMWADVVNNGGLKFMGRTEDVVLHIHSLHDLNGAGYSPD